MNIIKTVSLGVIASLLILSVAGTLLLLGIATTNEVIDGGSRALAIVGVFTLLALSVQGISRLNH